MYMRFILTRNTGLQNALHIIFKLVISVREAVNPEKGASGIKPTNGKPTEHAFACIDMQRGSLPFCFGKKLVNKKKTITNRHGHMKVFLDRQLSFEWPHLSI